MHYDSYGTEYRFDHLSGLSPDSCCFVGYRTEPMSLPDARRMESWAVLPSADRNVEDERVVSLELGADAFLTGAWYAEDGTVYATDLHGRIYVQRVEPSSRVRRWRPFDLGRDVELFGVWGIDDARVFVWGKDATRGRMWFRQGDAFVEMVAPPEPITVMRGAGSTFYAAGEGVLYRSTGDGWRRMPLRSSRPATGLCVVSDDEAWLTTDSGKLFEGTSHGWALRTQFDGPLYDVAAYGDRLLLAAGPRGLFELVRATQEIRSVTASIAPIAIETRTEHVLCLAEDYLAASKDLKTFNVSCRHAVQRLRGKRAPRWRT